MDKKLPIIIPIAAACSLPIIWYVFNSGSVHPLRADETIRFIPLSDQVMVVFTAFVMKPLYMLISLIMAWLLRKSHAPDLVALRWGLLAFFVGEGFCAINYLIFQEKSYLAEYLHSFGMVISSGFIAYALLEGLDRRIVQYSHPQKQCAFIALCGSCIKNHAVPCRIRRLFQLTSLILGLLTIIPLISEISEISYNTYIVGTLYNYSWLRVDQLFEIRYCPLLALTMFLSTFLVILRSKEQQIPKLAYVFLSAGVGALGFGLFRLFLGSVYLQNLAWAASWEEITEFLLMIIIAYILWLFRQRLEVDISNPARTGQNHRP